MADLFGRYRLDDRLGQGGMGVVYRAWDTVLERVVALKMMIGDQDADAAARERFLREARSAARLTHKNIVTVYDLGEHEGQPYLAMEFLDGEDLQRRLARHEKASLWRKVSIAIEICQGMEFAHAHGVVHRDLKPGNIFITASGGVKILDFGLARFMASQLTQSNMLLGTINYMSPEQVRGERADQQSDVFSIGVVLYELFGGRRAFEGDSAASTLYKILQEFPEPLWKIDSGLPRELTAIIDRALAKPRDERYADVTSLRHDLEGLQNTAPHAGPATPWPGSAPPVPSGGTSALEQTLVVPSGRAVMPSSAPASPAPSHHAGSVSASGSGAASLNPPLPAATAASGNPRGFWIGAGLGALAVAFLVVWMANRRVEPPSSPVSSLPPQTRAAVDPVAPAPTPPAAESTPSVAPAHPPAADRRSAQTRAAVSAAAPAARSTVPVVRPSARAEAAPRTVDTPSATPPAAVSAPPAVTPPAPPPTSSITSTVPGPQPSLPTTQVAVAPPVAPAPVAAGAPPLTAERANELLQRYKAALEARSLDQLKRIWPSLAGASETAIRQEFQQASRIAVDISEPQVSANGATGRISFVRGYSLTMVDGQRPQSTSRAVMEVRRSGDAWVIDSIQFTPR